MRSAVQTAPTEITAPLLLGGYRFRVCDTPEDVARALDVRRRVYRDELGLSFPIPDPYDDRSWLLLAEDVATGEAIGAIRLTPRSRGPLEVEEHFELPAAYRTSATVEITRFTIVAAYRNRTRVVIGLMKLVIRSLDRLGARKVVAGATRERIWNYKWFNMIETSMRAPYAGMNGAEVTLMVCDFAQAFAGLSARRTQRETFLDAERAEPPTPALVTVGGAR